MNPKIILFRIIRYLRYWLFAVDEHSLQSPLVFDIYQKALNPIRRRKVKDLSIEKLRSELQNNKENIQLNPFGSGSSLKMKMSKSIRHITKSGISNQSQSEILVNLIELCECKEILELGTSLGLNTMYLAKAKGARQVDSVEGNFELATLAQKHFNDLSYTNILVSNSDIDQFLSTAKKRYDLIYIDANHTYDATRRYFIEVKKMLTKEGVVVVDDINWSPDMTKAWVEITKTCPEDLIIENDKIGIVFVNRMPERKHYILHF